MDAIDRKIKDIYTVFTRPDFFKPLVITLLCIAACRLGMFVNIPFLNREVIHLLSSKSVAFSASGGRYSIFMLGIMPFVSAYVIIELLSLCIPYLKKLRQGTFSGRRKLKRLALALAFVLAVVHAKGVISGLKGTITPDGTFILSPINNYQYVLLIAILVGAFFALVGLCELISKFGIGNGFSLILLSGVCAEFFHRLPLNLKVLKGAEDPALFIATGVFCGMICFAFVLLRTKATIPCYHEKDEAPVDYFQLNLCPSSKIALGYAASIVMLPATLSLFFGFGTELADRFRPGSLWYNLVSLISILILSCMLAWAFLHPRRRLAKMRSKGWFFAETDADAEKVLLRRLLIYNLPWTFFLFLVAVVPSILLTFTHVPFYIGGSSIPLSVAVCLDLVCRFKFSQESMLKPVKVAEFHDVYDANMIKNHLTSAGIDSYLQGYHHRLLLYFFGPYIDISLMVAEPNKQHAQAVIRDYYGGMGLVA